MPHGRTDSKFPFSPGPLPFCRPWHLLAANWPPCAYYLPCQTSCTHTSVLGSLNICYMPGSITHQDSGVNLPLKDGKNQLSELSPLAVFNLLKFSLTHKTQLKSPSLTLSPNPVSTCPVFSPLHTHTYTHFYPCSVDVLAKPLLIRTQIQAPFPGWWMRTAPPRVL